MELLSRMAVVEIVTNAILKRQVLLTRYRHTDGSEVVSHRLAPFDIGSTTPRNRERFRNRLYAYSFTHRDDNIGAPDPKVCTFDIEHFLSMTPSDETFDENDLAARNRVATGYDYRTCRFALLPDRHWFGR
jgi:hypothetical protein